MAKRRVRHIRDEPHHVRGHGDTWWYEEPEGMVVVVEGHNARGEPEGKCRLIQWRYIKAALQRVEAHTRQTRER